MSALDLIKIFGGPGSIGFLLLASAYGLALGYLWPQRRPLARAWLGAVYLGYVILASPVTAHAVAGALPRMDRVHDSSQLAAIDALVVLGGDNGVGRVREAIRVWRAAAPRVVLVSGERWMVEDLLSAGVPPARIRHDEASRTTREQIDRLRGFLSRESLQHVGVVASRLHAPRVWGLLRAARIRAVVLPAPVDQEPAVSGAMRLVPSYAGLRVSRDALYEYAALAYYAYRGWIVQGP